MPSTGFPKRPENQPFSMSSAAAVEFDMGGMLGDSVEHLPFNVSQPPTDIRISLQEHATIASFASAGLAEVLQ